MSSPSTTRRGFLAVAGATALAGCSTVEWVASRDERATLREATGDVSAVSRGVLVTDAHREAARDRFDRELETVRSLVESADQRDGMDWSVEHDLASLEERQAEVEAMTDDWDAVDRLRSATAAAVSYAAYLRAWRGDLTPADARSDLAALREDLDGADDRLAYDRGTFPQTVAQLALAEERLREALRTPEYLERNLENLAYDSLAEARDHGDVDAEYAWPTAHVAGGVARGRLYLDDVSRLSTAHSRSEDHTDRMESVYDTLHPDVEAQYEKMRPMDEWYDVHVYDVSGGSSAEDYVHFASEFHADDYPASAVRDTLRAMVALPAQVELTDRLPEMSADELTAEDVATAGQRAHAAFRRSVANASSALELSLLHDVRRPLVGADESVSRQADGSDVWVEGMREAYLRYVYVRTAAGRVPEVVRRFERTA